MAMQGTTTPDEQHVALAYVYTPFAYALDIAPWCVTRMRILSTSAPPSTNLGNATERVWLCATSPHHPYMESLLTPWYAQ